MENILWNILNHEKMRYIKISTKCRMEREWEENEIGRRQTQNSIKSDVNNQIYRHLMLWRRIRVNIQMTIYSTSYSAILFFYLWLLRILFFLLVFLIDIQHSHYVDNAIFLDLNTPFSSGTHRNKEKIGTVTKEIMMRAKCKKNNNFRLNLQSFPKM